MSVTFYNTTELLALPDPEWLVANWLPRQGLITLYGQPGQGKSFVALDIALSIAEGVPWLGQHVTRQGPVIYIAAEGGRSIKHRVEAWMLSQGLEQVEAANFVLSSIDVRDQDAVESFIQKIESEDLYPELIVIDTLSRSFGGGEENASTDMMQFVDQVAKVSEDRQTAVMAVHHTNLGGGRERGHTSLRGSMDSMLKVSAIKTVDYKLRTVTVENDKQKDGESAPKILLEPYFFGKSLVLLPMEPPKIPVGVPELSELAVGLLKVCWAVEGEKVEKDEWMGAAEYSQRQFHHAANQLIDKKLVKRVGHGKYMLTGPGLSARDAYDEAG